MEYSVNAAETTEKATDAAMPRSRSTVPARPCAPNCSAWAAAGTATVTTAAAAHSGVARRNAWASDAKQPVAATRYANSTARAVRAASGPAPRVAA